MQGAPKCVDSGCACSWQLQSLDDQLVVGQSGRSEVNVASLETFRMWTTVSRKPGHPPPLSF